MQLKNHDTAFTGLEAAIVLIAFVVVAAVFSYVVLGAGFFTTQKSQETVYKGVEQATSNIQMIGQVYGTGASGGAVNQINFTIGLAPGAPSVDLTKMTIVFSNTSVSPTVFSISASDVGALSAGKFSATATDGHVVTTMSAQDQIQISMYVPTGATNIYGLGKNSKFTIELRPAVGASLPFERTVPPTIKAVTVLY